MSDEIAYTNVNISNSKKRQRTDEFEETQISYLSINSTTESAHVLEEPLTRIEFHQQTDIDRSLDTPKLDDEAISILSIPVYEQYASLLILESKAWLLCNTVFAVVSDFKLTKREEVKLTKAKVVIETVKELCLKYCSHDCIHYQCFQRCLIDEYVILCQPSYVKTVTIFSISLSTVLLIDNKKFHIFYRKEMKWYCDLCLSKCSKSACMTNFLPENDLNLTPTVQKNIQYTVISKLPIPASFDEIMTNIYEEQQLCNSLNLPIELFPEKELCEHDYSFSKVNITLERKGLILYTAKAVVDLSGHKVCSSICDGPCRCRAYFDGNSRLLLNINNRYFIHYDLLYEYSDFMTSSRNTLHGYLRAKNAVMKRLGRKTMYQYHILKHGWNAYLRMIKIDYKANFTCPICKENPEVIIMDGVTLGTLKHIPEVSHLIDLKQHFDLTTTAERIFISNSATRKRLKEFSSIGLTVSNYIEMLDSVTTTELVDYMLYSSVECDGLKLVHKDFPGVSDLLNILSYSSPLCGIFQLSLLTKRERELLVLSSRGGYLLQSELQQIFVKINPIKLLFNSLPTRTKDDGRLAAHHIVTPLLTAILTKIDHLFRRPTRQLVEYQAADNDYFMYFPTFSTTYKIPTYESEKPQSNIKCTKIYPKHNRFSPGMIVMACKHKVCYGFEILRERESTEVVYKMLISIFKRPPKMIIYGNACNLHTTCLLRDPALFRDTAFLVDRFHFSNHKCTPSYSMNSIQTDEVKRINSQVCEQIFSVIRRISTQIAYMRVENVFYNTRYFLSTMNEIIISNILMSS